MHIAVVYQFARQADDLADEGNSPAVQKLESLELYEKDLTNSLSGKYKNEFWLALHNTIEKYSLTPKYFYDLLNAFKQDVTKNRFETFDEIISYCSCSANPVGRIILEFFNIRDDESTHFSDDICTALQLTNFYQDVSIDIQKNRIYISLDEIAKFGVSVNQFDLKQNNANFEKLVEFQVVRTRKYFKDGSQLLQRLPRKLKRQIYMTILGGEKILDKIERLNFNVLNNRPKISKVDYIVILLKAILI
jgi:squalene synthase HpnC